jgi:hypothetical protein
MRKAPGANGLRHPETPSRYQARPDALLLSIHHGQHDAGHQHQGAHAQADQHCGHWHSLSFARSTP